MNVSEIRKANWFQKALERLDEGLDWKEENIAEEEEENYLEE